jgi:predicted O-linked N-acetylglucosamine transferase (SPINDLY family)
VAAHELSDEQLADVIQRDKIDVLVDLSLHMAGNRMLTFARKPAPVQISFSYPAMTGSPAIDWRVSDWELEPEVTLGGPEKVLRLARGCSFWCFDPHGEEPPVGPRSVMVNGHVTFGSFNNPAKITGTTLRLWSEAMKKVEGSKLLLLSDEPEGSAHVRGELEKLGIGAGRVSFMPKAARAAYLGYYGQIDIALDPYPYQGHTTTCDALFMGVPVIGLSGKLPISRATNSLLKAVGLEELIADSPEKVVEVTAELARDIGRLMRMSGELRERMRRSCLMDAAAYTRAVEGMWREAWVGWCGR